MTEYRIQVDEVRTYDDFVAAFNAGMIESVGGHWNGDLNAFHDYLSWPQAETYRLVLVGWARCAATLAELPYWGGGGATMLAMIEEIFRDNPHVTLSYA